MSSKTGWIDAGKRLELRDENGRVLESEIERDGRCIHFDLTDHQKDLKNVVRRFLGLQPVHPPRVVEAAYQETELGKARKQTNLYIREVEKQHMDALSTRATKRDIVQAFRERYPRTRD